MELFDKGLVKENKIYVNADLVGTFKENWTLLVTTLHQPDFTQPFFYLQNDQAAGLPFWFLKPTAGMSINAHIKSVNILAVTCDYAFIAEDLYSLLQYQEQRLYLQAHLLNTYFSDQKEIFYSSKNRGIGYMNEVESYVLNEPKARFVHLDKYIEEDVFVRGGLFKKLVPKVYNRTCSFTGMRLESLFAHNFVDACHIVPFSVTQDDRVSNGITLCPNLHRAFDRGLVSIDDRYRILVSSHLIEDKNHTYSLSHLGGRQILLPLSEQYFPSQDNLAWHRANIFKV
jgi:putative restriction endonuclease